MKLSQLGNHTIKLRNYGQTMKNDSFFFLIRIQEGRLYAIILLHFKKPLKAFTLA